MALDKTPQEKFLIAKMVERVRQLNHENRVFERKLEEPNLSDEDYDLYQGLMDKNIGEQQAYRRMEDNLREWRQNENAGPAGQKENVEIIASGPREALEYAVVAEG